MLENRVKFQISIFLLVFLSQNIFSQEYSAATYIVTGEADIWSMNTSTYNKSNAFDTIKNGETVTGIHGMYFLNTPYEEGGIVTVDYNKRKYYILTSSLALPNNTSLPSDWITKSSDDYVWLISSYLDILTTQDRNRSFKYEKPAIDYLLSTIMPDWYTDDTGYWWRYTHVYESLMFGTVSIKMGGFFWSSFWITNIESQGKGYKLTLQGDSSFSEMKEIEYSIRLPFPKYSDRKSFDLIFIPDGDYLDVYLDSQKNYFISFVKANKTIVDELNHLLETNTCNLSNITYWPRRADGSMDYPPPQLVQAAPGQPETVAADTPPAEDEDVAAVTTARETVAQQPGIGLPLIIVLAASGIAVICGVVVFLIRRKR
jgi:hypothetical protein